MGAAVAATTMGQLPVFLTGALSVQIGRDMTLRSSQLGIAVAAFFGVSALCSVPMGHLADRFGGITVMRYGLLPAAVSVAVIGVGVHRWETLTAALTLAGVANGAIQPAANRYLVRTVDDSHQGFAFGVKQAAIPAATLLSGLAVPAVSHTAGWRSAFIAAAVLAVGVGLFLRGPAAAAHRVQSVAPVPAPRFARSALITLAVGIGAGSAAVNAMGAFFIRSAVSIGTSDSHAGLIAALASVASLLVRLGIGRRADSRVSGHLRVVAMLCALGSLGPLLLATGGTRLLLPAALIGYGAGWGWAGLFTFAVARTHPASPGRATGLTQVGASTGACLGPLSFGFTAAHFGYPPAWLGAAVLLAVAAVVLLLGRRSLYAAGVVQIRPVAGGKPDASTPVGRRRRA